MCGQHDKRRRRRNYQRRKQRDGCADIAIAMAEAMVVGVGGASASVVRTYRCRIVGGRRKVFGVNMPE